MESYRYSGFLLNCSVIVFCFVTVLDQGASATPLHLNTTLQNFFSGNFLFANQNDNKLGSYRVVGELNDSCSRTRGCREYAYRCSIANICECARGYIPDQTFQICVGGVGSRCIYDSHCILNAYCKGQETCACKFEFPIPSSDNWTCKSSASHQSTMSWNLSIFFVLISAFWIL